MEGRSAGTLVVGAGLMGRWHAQALRRLGVRVGAIVDPDAGAADRLARSSGARPFATLEEALAHGRFTVAHLCTPLDTHLALSLRLLEAGCHLMVEKPLARSAQETATLLDAAGAAGRLVCPVHQFPFQRGMRRASGWLAGMGRLLHVDFVACSAGAEGHGEEAVEAVARDILPHPLSILSTLLGEAFPRLRWQEPIRSPGEFRVAGEGDGTSVGVLVSMAGRPTRNTVRLLCEQGTIHVDLFHGFAFREGGDVSRRHKITRPFAVAGAATVTAAANLVRRAAIREPAYPGLRELFSRFHDAVRSGGRSPIPPERILDVAAVRDRLSRRAS